MAWYNIRNPQNNSEANMTTKRIAAITMARNDEFFLNRWIKYYGEQIGTENLYIYLDLSLIHI